MSGDRVTSTVERLRAAGAVVLGIADAPDRESYAVLMQDPEGHEFCVV
ncbi:VOC family protein [Melissospora conviva]